VFVGGHDLARDPNGVRSVIGALDSTAGFTFLLSSMKAALEEDVTLKVVLDAHPPRLQMPRD
jgi:hypothetical protein